MPRLRHSELFRYALVIHEGQATWRASDVQLRGLITWGDARGIARSAGPRPFVEIDAGRWTLRAARRDHAAVASITFELDAELVSFLRPRDTVYLARSRQAGIGISVLRNDRLALAAGAATLVPVTCGPHGGIGLATIGEAIAVARGHRKLILEAGERAWLPPFALTVLRGLRSVFPWHDEVVGVEDTEIAPEGLATRCAELLALPNAGFTSTAWPDGVPEAAPIGVEDALGPPRELAGSCAESSLSERLRFLTD